MTSKAVKLDDQIVARLNSLAERRRRTPHWLMKEAILQYVEREEEVEKIKQDTLDRWAQFQRDGKTVSADRVHAWLKSWGTSKELPCPVRSK